MSEHDTRERIDRFVRLIAESKDLPVWVLMGTTYVAPAVLSRPAILVNVDEASVERWAERVKELWQSPPDDEVVPFAWGSGEPGVMRGATVGQNPCGEVGLPSVAFDASSSPRASVADPRFPHSCPRCGGAAYVGMAEVDCRARCA